LAHHWLRIDDRLWEGAFFNGGDTSGLSAEELQARYKHLEEGEREFERLGDLATGNFPSMRVAMVGSCLNTTVPAAEKIKHVFPLCLTNRGRNSPLPRIAWRRYE
jgi:hypothetical protein